MNQKLILLNSLAKNIYKDGLNGHPFIVKEWGENTSTTTFFDKKSEVVQLEPLVAVPVSMYIPKTLNPVPEDFKGIAAVHRFALSYSMVSRITDEKSLASALSHILNAGQIALSDKLGMLNPFFKITILNPDGSDPFREMDNYAAIEGRIYAIKE